MGKYDSIEDAAKTGSGKEPADAKAGGDAGSSASDGRAGGGKKTGATLPMRVEAPMMALASIEAPRLAPSLDILKLEAPRRGPTIDMHKLDEPTLDLPKDEEIKPTPGDDASEPAADAAGDAQTSTGAPPRMSRFTLLAASLVMCAAFGGMIGVLIAATITRPIPVASLGPPTVMASLEDINSLKEQIVQARVDLTTLKASIDAGNRNANSQLTRISERVERMERSNVEPVAKLSKAVEALERRAEHAKTAAREATGSIAPPKPVGEASKDTRKPAVVDGWVLRGISDGTAYIDGRYGLIEVDQGDTIPGVGRVEAIRKQDGRWVVVTPKGLIVGAR
jgi:hypothetical protein